MLCRKSLKASASLLQVGGRAERHAKAKNFTISSNARSTDRKMRMTPPRSFSLSPSDAHSRCTSGACTTRRLTVTCVHGTAEHAGTKKKKQTTHTHTHKKTPFTVFLSVQTSGYTHQHAGILLHNFQAHKQM